ncbi:hypothetical protein E4198_04560 [Streptomyces sp. RKND-216]|uniref:DUF6039 family protein n=1 Tax=Streptomyces sp. RKND-216 TaxID=2562581 RepID=UPI00109D94A4|nr:DUF6039 family protein [Streptomyces sp. RKND-216]THA24105.1 hypothetical protein E4198_04560 [Streptomyces sp. RKND-216]
MAQTEKSDRPETGSTFLPALATMPDTGDSLLHSGNAGLIIHRAGQLRHEFRAEGRAFASDLVSYLNKPVAGVATIMVFEEILGDVDRLHWLIHMKMPNDYRRFLHVADHDASFKEITEGDRLPQRDGGNWERMYVEGSFQERVYVPQHGLDHHDDEEGEEPETFVPPALHQTGLPVDRLRHSADTGLTILRSAQTKFEFRNEARHFAFEWARHVNRALTGDVTAYLYEETFGQQDRIHWMLHLDNLDSYRRLLELKDSDQEFRAMLGQQFVPARKGGGTWERTFVDAGIRDTVLTPLHSGTVTGF